MMPLPRLDGGQTSNSGVDKTDVTWIGEPRTAACLRGPALDCVTARRVVVHTHHPVSMFLNVETEREEDGRWIAEVVDLPGVMAYGETRDTAVARAEALALRVLADRLENAEAGPDLVRGSFRAA